MIVIIIIIMISSFHLVYKMSKQSDTLLFLSNQLSKTSKLFIYYHKWQRIAANPHI